MKNINNYIFEKFKINNDTSAEEKYDEVENIIYDYFSAAKSIKFDVTYQEVGNNRVSFLIVFNKEYTYKETRDWGNAITKRIADIGYKINFHIDNKDRIRISLTAPEEKN